MIGGFMDSLRKTVTDALSAEGNLAKKIPGFIEREAQVELALAISEAIEQKSMLAAEAGTGTGKTFAYLVPCLLSAKKTLIATATKTLQDQLFEKDIPRLKKALALPTKVHNLKGRMNYLCKHRVHLHAEIARFTHPQIVEEVQDIRKKLARLKWGERSELTEIKEDSSVWPYVTSTEDNCLGNQCTYYNQCFLVQSRRQALDADVVIINHHLFFADSRLKGEGLGELLPAVDVVIFDEAHKLSDIATEFYGEHKGSRQLLEAIDSIIEAWPAVDLTQFPLKQWRRDLEKIIQHMHDALLREEEKESFEKIQYNQEVMSYWPQISTLIETFLAAIDTVFSAEEALSLGQNLRSFHKILQHFKEKNSPWIRWIERFKQSFILHLTPFEVSQSFKNQLEIHPAAYVFTSATLTMNNSFDCFTKPLGLEKIETLMLQSPFDYQKQALLYLPRALPDPNDSQYYEQLLEQVIPLIEACQGRSFFLFTSHKALKWVATVLKDRINFPLLIQGDEAKPILLARFRQLGNAVLLGTATFWEGVDVQGDALSCVIIDKLPFLSPIDPVIKGKAAYLKQKGLSGFNVLSLPSAVLALKQGVGRLIRAVDDRGILVLADPRLTGRSYGAQVFASLPLLPKTRDREKALAFIQTMIRKDEVISN